MGAGPNDPFLCSLSAGTVGKRVSWSTVEKLWSTCVKPLGPIRASQVSVHQGRHSFVSHAIASGRNLTDVRDAAGHSSVATTNIYSHALDSDVGRELYGPTRKQQLREAES
jgi:site-specific recombinase XerC